MADARSAAALRQIAGLRDALDGLTESLSQPCDASSEIEAVAERLAAEADADVRRIREDADRSVQALSSQAQALRTERDTLSSALARIETEAALLRSELQTALERAEANARQLTHAGEVRASIESRLRVLEADFQHAASCRAAAEADLGQAHTTIQHLLADVEDLRGRVETLSESNAGLLGELAQAHEERRRHASLAADLEAALALATEAHQQQQATAAQLDQRNAEIARLRQAAFDVAETARQRDAAAAELDALRATIASLQDDVSRSGDERRRLESEVAALQAIAEQFESLRREHADAVEAAAGRHALARQLEAADERIAHLVDELASARQSEGARAEMAAALAEARERLNVLQAEVEGGRRIRAEYEGALAELEAARSRLGELQAARKDLDMLHAERERLTTEVAEVRAARAQLEQTISELQAALTQAEADATHLREVRCRAERQERELAEARATHEQTARISVERITALERDLADAREEASALLAAAPPSTAVSAEELSSSGSMPAEDVEFMRGEVDRMLALLDATARAVSELAAVGTSTELLAELVKRLSLQFSRVALFRVKGNRLEGERHIGIDDIADITRLVIPLSVESILRRAVNSGEIQVLHGDDVPVRSGTPFGGTPTYAIAVPVVLQGTTLAVVYADDSDMPESARSAAVRESSVGFARLLVGQVVVLLVRHTHELKTLAELTQYAVTLIQEAREMYEADVQAGAPREQIRKRLKENVECASQLYAYRAAMEGTAAAALLDQQIVAELQESTPFAADLAAVVGQMAETELQITAEAS